jgi:hypothetical protein
MFKQSKKIFALFTFASIFLTIFFITSCQEEPSIPTANEHPNISKLAEFSLPPGVTLTSATLYIYEEGYDNDHVINVHNVTSNWEETTVTWNTKPSFNVIPINSFNSFPGLGWRSVDITSAVQAWINGTANYGVLLDKDPAQLTTAGFAHYNSRENATNQPYLHLVTSAGVMDLAPIADVSVWESEPDNNKNIEILTVGRTSITKQSLIQFENEVCIGSIGDFTFWDKDANGIFDGSDEALPGVGVELRDAQNNVIATTTSDANGAYSFTGLCPGDYYVCYTTMPPGYSAVPTCTNNTDNATNNMNHCNCILVSLPQPGGQSDNPNIDFGFKKEGICLRMPDDSPCGPLEHQLFVDVDINGDVTVRFDQNLNVNDNSYGTTQVGWGANAPSTKNHKFGDLTGSDKAQFIFYDVNGTKVLDILVDYLSAKSGTPSGYASLGVSGGEGKVNFGQASWVLMATTTLDNNLNNLGFPNIFLVNSPQTTSSTSYTIVDPAYAAWNFVNGYTVKISHTAFGAAGFGKVVIGEVHNSPPKCGPNAHIPVLCNGTPAPETCADGKPKKLEMKYEGTNCVTPGGTPYGPPCNSQASGKVIVTGDPGNTDPVYIKAYDKQTTSLVWFQGVVALNGTFVIDATAKNKTRLGTNTIVKIYSVSSSGGQGTLKSTIQFHTSCSQPLNLGDMYGSLELTNYVAE